MSACTSLPLNFFELMDDFGEDFAPASIMQVILPFLHGFAGCLYIKQKKKVFFFNYNFVAFRRLKLFNYFRNLDEIFYETKALVHIFDDRFSFLKNLQLFIRKKLKICRPKYPRFFRHIAKVVIGLTVLRMAKPFYNAIYNYNK